jgi:hypothetical protein
VRALALLAACAALAWPAAARADAPAAPSSFVLAGSLAGGLEPGLSHGRAGLFELETLAGLDLDASGAKAGLTIRPELALALGLAPDGSLALRPGVRASLPETPLWLRAAFDWSTAREKNGHWRWFLVGVAWELRVTALLGFSVEVDSGVPLSTSAGLPLLVRAGATFRP